MLRRKVPQYCRHKASGQAYVKIDGRRVYLGVFGTPESHQRYTKEISKWQAKLDAPPKNLTVSHLAVAYIEHCRTYYRKGGQETTEVQCIRLALRALLKHYHTCPIDDFDALKLEKVRDAMIVSRYVRTSINRHIGRIKRMFKWGVKRKLVARGTYVDVCTLEPLTEDRSAAWESEPVGPVNDEDVDAILPHVSRPVRGLIQFMRLTGARPGEAMILRACDMDTSGPIWEYRPARHKTQHHRRRRERVVMIGPAGQELLTGFLKDDPQAYLFDPRDAIEEVARRYRKGAKRRRDIGSHYTLHSLASAIRRACEVAFGMPDDLRNIRKAVAKLPPEKQDSELRRLKESAAEWRRDHCWSANQLRHSFGTKARQAAGIEGSRVVLGHASAVTSEIYAERDFSAARAVVAKIG